MIIVCQKCDSRLQVDEAKVPARPFVVRCPKCNSSIESGMPTPTAPTDPPMVNDAGSQPENANFEQPNPAPLFQAEGKPNAVGPENSLEKLSELLAGLANQSPANSGKSSPIRPIWDPRKALICITEENRESVARSLSDDGYQVFVATDTRQAVDRMRENLLDLVLLDPRFDPVEQGPVFITREVNILRPAQRRRLFFVLLSPSLRTMDNHTAFLNNVNAIINLNEIADLPKLVEQRLRAYNELYKEFNQVLGMPAL
jgi:predicted Zn finger-like uncharacterized protein